VHTPVVADEALHRSTHRCSAVAADAATVGA
jgi:hypothetical protein